MITTTTQVLKMSNPSINDIKPFKTQNYHLMIQHPLKRYFVIKHLSTGQQSPLYTDNLSPNALIYAYNTFLEAFNHDPQYFDLLCEQELH